MIELKPLTCQNCGAQIDRRTMKCPYCDTQYERKNDGIAVRYVVDRLGTHRICAQVKIDEEMTLRDPEGSARYVMDRLRHEIADGLLDYMKISTSKDFDILNRCQIIRGEVRVIDPVFSHD